MLRFANSTCPVRTHRVSSVLNEIARSQFALNDLISSRECTKKILMLAWCNGLILGAYPLAFMVVGLVVLFMRVEARHAWLLALLFAGFITVSNIPNSFAAAPGDLRDFLLAYRAIFLSLIAPLFYWFFAVFPSRSPIDLRWPWLTGKNYARHLRSREFRSPKSLIIRAFLFGPTGASACCSPRLKQTSRRRKVRFSPTTTAHYPDTPVKEPQLKALANELTVLHDDLYWLAMQTEEAAAQELPATHLNVELLTTLKGAVDNIRLLLWNYNNNN